MKMIYLSCNISLLEDVLDIAKTVELHDFQVLPHVLFSGSNEEPRMDSPVWPGHNASLLFQINDEEKAAQLFDKVREFNQKTINSSEQIKAYSWQIAEWIE